MTETYNPILYKQYVSIWQMFIPNQAPPDDMSYLYARNGVIMPAQPGNYFARMNDIRYAIDIASTRSASIAACHRTTMRSSSAPMSS